MHMKTGDWAVVLDGAKYVIYENKGDDDILDLRVVTAEEQSRSPTRDSGTDKPGRYAGPGDNKSSIEQTDWHERDELAFVRALADKVNTARAETPNRRLVIVADPRSLGRIKPLLTPSTTQAVDKFIQGDFTHHPVKEIEKLIASS